MSQNVEFFLWGRGSSIMWKTYFQPWVSKLSQHSFDHSGKSRTKRILRPPSALISVCSATDALLSSGPSLSSFPCSSILPSTYKVSNSSLCHISVVTSHLLTSALHWSNHQCLPSAAQMTSFPCFPKQQPFHQQRKSSLSTGQLC